MRMSWRRIYLLLPCAVLILATFLTAFRTETAHADQITDRSLTLLSGGGGDGGSLAGGTVNHQLDFTLPAVGDPSVGSILFEYCTVASVDPCVTPTGLDTTSASLGDQSGATGFTIDNTTNGAPYITRTAASITADTTVSYRLDDVDNPTTADQTFFVRISTYTSTDTSGSAIDTGSVAASTATQIVLTGVMPESLIFCTGEDISETGGIPDCSTATAGNISFNQLFSPSDTAYATSEMAASTNAISGYSITVAGPTLTSGANTIAAIGGTATTSSIGTGQFGLNLVDNATPDVGTNITPASDVTTRQGNPATNFDTADNFAFTAGSANVIANSDDDNPGTAAPTDSQIYTVSYIVNVSGSQVAGTYATTLTYVCTPTF